MKNFYFLANAVLLLCTFTLHGVTIAQSLSDPDNELLYDFHDNGQWHADFAISDLQGWILIDVDGLTPDGPSFHDFPNKGNPMSFIVYNPSKTSPPNELPAYEPRTGEKYFMSISSWDGPSENWMITQELAPHPGGTFSFYAKGTASWTVDEQFKVAYSTDGSDPSDFVFYNNGMAYNASLNWTRYQFSVPANAKHLAIICVSQANAFLVDDIEFEAHVPSQAPDHISEFDAEIQMNEDLAIEINWVNPQLDSEQNPLSELSGVKVLRGSHPMGFTVVADITDVQMGQQSLFTDTQVQAGNLYAYRLVPYNSHGNGISWTSDYYYLAVETVPGAPHTVEFAQNENQQMVISWNHVDYGENGGLLQDPVAGYTIIRSLGSEVEVLAQMHPENTFTETNVPDFNLYQYEIIAQTDEDNVGPAAIRHTYSGMGADHHPVTFGITQSNQVFELPRNSILSQSIYMADEIGSTGLITGLAYFSNLGSYGGTTGYKIYISKTDREVFGPNNNSAVWEYYADQKLVFDGPITFEAGRNAIEIPLDQPFYYDADSGKNIIITVIKPLIENPPSVNSPRFFNTPVETLRTYYAIGYGVDMSTITTQPATWATEEVPTIPSIVTQKVQNYGVLYGTVTLGGEETALEGVEVEITPLEESYQYEKVYTGIDGNYIIPALLPGTYTATFFKEGYNAFEADITVEENQTIQMDVVLSTATPILVHGLVTDQDQNPIPHAYVNLSGYSSYSTMTNDAGEYTLNAFGSKEYELEVTHPLYFSGYDSFVSEEHDHNLADMVLEIMPHKPMNVLAEILQGNGVVSWDKPYGLDNQTMLAWGSLTQLTAWGWGGAPFTAGIRFTISDLNNLIPEGGKLTHIKAYIANNAQIHLEVFEGHNAANLIYTHPENITHAGWYTFELSRAIPVDVSKELWIGIRFEPGYGPYPIGIDEGPNAPQRKGSMLYENGIWTPISLTNKNWNIYGKVHTTVEANPVGYKIFRNESGSPDWIELSEDMIIEQEEFTDETLANMEAGIYQYGVMAQYGESLFSDLSYSNELLLDVLFNIAIKPLPNTGSAENSYIRLWNESNFYEKTLTGADEQVQFNEVWTGTYSVMVQLENFEKVVWHDVYIGADQTLEVPLEELRPMPVNLAAQQHEDASVAYVSWSVHATYTDDMEPYPDFAKSEFGDYILKDLDGLPTYTYMNFSWPGEGDPMSFMVFNPYATTPPITLDAYSGRRFLVAMAGPDGASNDWLIIPAGEGTFSFMAQSLVADDLETINVLHSASGTNVSDFTPFDNGENLNPPAGYWHEYEFEAPQGTNYVAINYISNDTYFVMIDDITREKEYTHMQYFNVYLDGSLIESHLEDSFVQVSGLTQAHHLLEIEAVYASGVSEKAQIELQGSVNLQQYHEAQFRVFPNPGKSPFVIQLEKAAKVHITDLKGVKCYAENLQAGTNRVYLDLPPGTYVVKAFEEQKVHTQILIVQ